MVWRIDDPQGNEAGKVKYEVVPYTRGVVLDLGCGPFKAFPHFIGVDNGHHSEHFGWQFKPDVNVETCERLEGTMTGHTARRLGLVEFEDEDHDAAMKVHTLRIPDGSVDAVFSSHLLEHIEDTAAALAEWWRVIKPGGYLVLYLPHKRLYPNIGTEGANPDHKHDFEPDDIERAMQIPERTWDLVVNEDRAEGYEYSFLQVFQKLDPATVEGQPRFAWLLSHNLPRPAKTACVVRYGGIGDMIMAASILPQLKQQGYHVTMMTWPMGREVVAADPNIDAFILQDKDQVPNGELPDYWLRWSKRFTKFVNLCESVEGTLLAMPGRANHAWPQAMRQKYLDTNYLEFTHELAGLPFKPAPHFFSREDERDRVTKFREGFGEGAYVVLWCLAGSSMHKAYPHTDAVVAELLLRHPNVRVIFVGDVACQLLEQQWQAEPRVCRLSGKIGVRETLALACHGVDCVVGPETGVLNAVSHLKVPKVILLSHSSRENLTKHWVNTVNLTASPVDAPCYPCHQMHTDRAFCPDWKIPIADLEAQLKDCNEYDRNVIDEHTENGLYSTGAALCAYGIDPGKVAKAVLQSQRKRLVVPA